MVVLSVCRAGACQVGAVAHLLPRGGDPVVSAAGRPPRQHRILHVPRHVGRRVHSPGNDHRRAHLPGRARHLRPARQNIQGR